MDAGMTAMLVSGLGVGLVEAFKLIVEEGIAKEAIKRGFRPLWDLVDRGYEEAQHQAALSKALLAALDEVAKDQQLDDYEQLIATLKLTGLGPKEHKQLAGVAVEMARYEPSIIPPEIFTALNLDESRRELLAGFLWRFRKHLLDVPGYAEGISYANDLDRQDRLAGLTRKLISIDARARELVSINTQLLKFRNLTDKEDQAARDYLEDIRQTLSELPLPLARKQTGGPLTARIKRIYVPLTLRDQRAEAEAKRRQEKSERLAGGLEGDDALQAATAAEIGQVLARYERFILLGPPGRGKTTLLRRVALAFAEQRTAEDLNWPEAPPLLPVYVRLRNFGAFLATKKDFVTPGPGALAAYLDHYFRTERNIALTADFFDSLLRQGNCLVLLDGLDEVSKGRGEVAQQVDAFIRHYGRKGNRFGLGSRPGGYESVEIYLRKSDLAVCEVNELAPEGIKTLIHKLFELIETDKAQQTQDSLGLAAKILASEVLTSLAANPLFCTALVQVYKDIFQEIVDLLLGFWKAQEDELAAKEELAKEDGTGKIYRDLRTAVDTKKSRLCYLAFQMQKRRQAELTQAEAVAELSAYLQSQERRDREQAEEWAENFLYDSHLRSGILVEQDPGGAPGTAVYAWVHQYFREYLAATAMTNLRDREFKNLVLEHLGDDWWEEVILLAGAHEMLSTPKREDMIDAILKQCEKYRLGEEQDKWYQHILLVGRAVCDMGERLPGPVQERAEKALQAAMVDPRLEPVKRAAAANTLDALGWRPESLSEFIYIETDSRDERLRPFWIGRYPVTNAQYLRFLRAEDYADRELWVAFPCFDAESRVMVGDWGTEGWDWLQKALADPERSPEGTCVYPRYWYGPRFGITRRYAPVVGVTWYEAQAYGRWLLRHWEELEESRRNPEITPYEIRLPTGAEWIEAAGGLMPPNRYPWDQAGKSSWPGLVAGLIPPNRYSWNRARQSNWQGPVAEITSRANVKESDIEQTTPVGMYPQGVSWPYKLWDMAGNVWEWQANYWKVKEGMITLRGGAWSYNYRGARILVRNRYHPYFTWDHFGFRVVALPS